MAAQWKKHNAVPSSNRKASLADKAAILSGSLFSVNPTAIALAPQKVAEPGSSKATANTFQRKVFFDGTRFFIVYWDGTTTKLMLYTSSLDGVTWETPVTLFPFSIGPGGGDALYGGNVDLEYVVSKASNFPGRTVKFILSFLGSTLTAGIYEGYISNATLTYGPWSSYSGYGSPRGGLSCRGMVPTGAATRGALFSMLSANSTYRVSVMTAYYGGSGRLDACSSTTPSVSDTGGVQLLRYETSGDCRMLGLWKGGDDILYWSLVKGASAPISCPINSLGVTLSSGYDSFCATSEILEDGTGSAYIHLVYVKSTGELVYRTFSAGAWSAESVLVSSGASYPVLAAGSGGRLYLFYVKSGVIKLMKFNGSAWESEATLCSDHSYDSPVYLSSNQNVQSSRICLVWMEGSASPYGLWICVVGD